MECDGLAGRHLNVESQVQRRRDASTVGRHTGGAGCPSPRTDVGFVPDVASHPVIDLEVVNGPGVIHVDVEGGDRQVAASNDVEHVATGTVVVSVGGVH